jgi:hypothetical protein
MVVRTPAQKRSDFRVEFSRFLAALLVEFGVTHNALADFAGVPSQKVQLWCDDEKKEVPGFSDVRLFPREIAKRCCAWMLADHDFVVVDSLVDPQTTADHVVNMVKLAREGSEGLVAYGQVYASGAPNPQMRRNAIKELYEAGGEYIARAKQLEAEERASRVTKNPNAPRGEA